MSQDSNQSLGPQRLLRNKQPFLPGGTTFTSVLRLTAWLPR